MLKLRHAEPGRPDPIRERPTVAVIGAGASGTLVTVQLLREASVQRLALRIVLIDRSEHGAGIAYSTSDPRHRLNVPASRMSAFPDASDDFRCWRERTVGDGAAGAYAPRAEYGRYLRDVLDAARLESADTVALAQLVAEVAAIEPLRDRVRVRLGGGGVVDSQLAVLALGNNPAVAPGACEELQSHPCYVNDPWAPGALAQIESRTPAAALLIGTGLTMVDVALVLAADHPERRVVAVSRTGMLPRGHRSGRVGPGPTIHRPDPDASLPALVDAVLAASAAGDPSWQCMVDDLRPFTQELWQRLSLEQRAEFLATRHRAWSVHRHRMAPEVAATVDALGADGRLCCRPGPFRLTPRDPAAIDVSIGDDEPFAAELVVNCTGRGLDPRTSREPLVRQLLDAGHARAHPLGTGFDTAAGGALRGRDGALQSRLLTLGPPRFGELYETIAIPEIRIQARDVAQRVVATLAATPLTARQA